MIRWEVAVPGDKSDSHRAVLIRRHGGRGEPGAQAFLDSRGHEPTIGMVSAGTGDAGRGGCRPTELRITGGGAERVTPEPARRDSTRGIPAPRSGSGAGLSGGPAVPMTSSTGDPYLRRRTDGAVVPPLARMGASNLGRGGETGFPRSAFLGGALKGIRFEMPRWLISAQVKIGALLLVRPLRRIPGDPIVEPLPTRDHTENDELSAMGASIFQREARGHGCVLPPGGSIPRTWVVPGESRPPPSSSSWPPVTSRLGARGPQRRASIPSARGWSTCLRRMGAEIRFR
jgi:5-enolpyruvylshikimate-3-phosphate synthase